MNENNIRNTIVSEAIIAIKIKPSFFFKSSNIFKVKVPSLRIVLSFCKISLSSSDPNFFRVKHFIIL
ncbi:hypothetical protein EHP00_1934 [Ecytonucleospora hepatopenaei]|uniref:Uncharacterized protein n=1 Tax=Ecytonucleospora hepatopenaei TaxID=646526 RepID=A0A1W0E852_9MICR|nr:hypothetical protein EHP00_1934 [Ecytonucleospora hepatopenaei]